MQEHAYIYSDAVFVNNKRVCVCEVGIHLEIVIYLFGVLRRFQHCTGHITTGSWKGRGNQYIQFVRVLYCKLPTNGKQLPAIPLEAVPGTEPPPQRWEARVLPLCHRGPSLNCQCTCIVSGNTAIYGNLGVLYKIFYIFQNKFDIKSFQIISL